MRLLDKYGNTNYDFLVIGKTEILMSASKIETGGRAEAMNETSAGRLEG